MYDNDFIIMPYIRAKIKILQGRCYLDSGHLKDAMKMFESAMKILHYKFPSNKTVIKIKAVFLFKRLKISAIAQNQGISCSEDDNHYDQLCSCLTQIFLVFRVS